MVRRWRVAGRKRDIISALLNLGKCASDAPSLKRPRDFQDAAPSPDVALLESSAGRPIAGSSRASLAQQRQALELSAQEPSHLFSLPLYTKELGRLPIYDSFEYAFNENLQIQSNLNGISPLQQSDLYPHFDPPVAHPVEMNAQLFDGLDALVEAGSFASRQLVNSDTGLLQAGDGVVGVDGLRPHSFDVPSGYE